MSAGPGEAAAVSRPQLRSLQSDLLGAGDRQILRVVAMVDAMPVRGAADQFIAPLRRRLAVLRPQRRLNFTRLLFTPIDPRIVAPAKTEPAGLPRLEGVFDRWLEWPGNAGLPGNCPFFAGVVEFDDDEGPVRDRLVRLFRDFRQVVEQLVASAVRHGHLRPGTDAVQFAHELLALRYAHHWSAGFMRDPAALARTRTSFARLIGRPLRESRATPAA